MRPGWKAKGRALGPVDFDPQENKLESHLHTCQSSLYTTEQPIFMVMAPKRVLAVRHCLETPADILENFPQCAPTPTSTTTKVMFLEHDHHMSHPRDQIEDCHSDERFLVAEGAPSMNMTAAPGGNASGSDSRTVGWL